MSIALIHPAINHIPSGGNIYNKQLLLQADLFNIELNSVELNSINKGIISKFNKRFELIIWDSLFLEQLAKFSEDLRSGNSCLLCHYLPSLNPLLNQNQKRYFEKIENHIIEKMQFVIVTGQLIKDEILQRFPNKPVYLSVPGVDSAFTLANKTKKSADSTVQILTVANLIAEKGYLSILKSLTEIAYTPWHWHICGNDRLNLDFTIQFWRTVKNFDLEQNITYHGTVLPKELADLMLKSDLLVSASYYESYGMALAEAATMRLPIISTDTGAASEIVQHEVNGLLFPVDDNELLSGHLRRLINDGFLRKKYASVQKFEPQTWENCFKTFLSICQGSLPESIVKN